MVRKQTLAAVIVAIFLLAPLGLGATLEGNWNNFIHYASIGRADLAAAHGRELLASDPNASEMLRLSEKDPQGYATLLDMKARSKNAELAEIAGKMLEVIEKGRSAKRSDASVITEEINRLSSTARGRMTAAERLREAGEYAVPYMLNAIADESRKDQFANIAYALEQMDKDAVRPLVAALQTRNAGIQATIIRALGSIKDTQALPYLKYIVEQSQVPTLVTQAKNSISEIDPGSLEIPAADLFLALARSYYAHSESLAPSAVAGTANIWFWDAESNQLTRAAVPLGIFNELMAMRCCEWALRADPSKGDAIGIWLAAFFKAESTGIPMPDYFGPGHADAMTYATIAGPEYVQQALAMALADKNQYMALGLINALTQTAGQASMMYATASGQPLVKALYYDDRQVRYSAAIAMAASEPKTPFADSQRVVELLAEALSAKSSNDWPQATADEYAMKAIRALNHQATRNNKVLDLAAARDALIAGTKDSRRDILIGSLLTLALMDGPDAQRTVAAVALADSNDSDLRLQGFKALAASAKAHGNLLLDDTVNAIYEIVKSDRTEPGLRSAAAAAYGALNLPSDKARKLILDQARN